MAKSKFFSGDYRLVIIKVVVIAVLIYALYKLVQKLVKGKSQGELEADNIQQNSEQFLQELETAVPPADDSGEVVLPTITQAEAGNIANIQFQAMDGAGTDESSIFSSLCELNGADLILVAQEFGTQDGKTIFQWYYDELCSYVDSIACASFSGCGTDCTSYFFTIPAVGCSELEFMKKIWQRSGLPF